MLSSASDKTKLLAKNFSKNSNLDDSVISLPVFPSRSNLKLHNISVTPKIVKKLIMNLDLSKASGPDFVPVVVLKNCELELSYILAKFFFFFSILVFFHEHSRFTGQQGKGEGIYLTPLYHFHPLHGHLDISRAITAESSPLHIAGSRTRTGNLWFPSASR